MKKILSVVLLLSAMVSYAADYSVVIPATSVAAGHSAEMSIEINNTNDLMAYQFYLDVPAGITITGGSVAGTRTETLGGATVNFDAAGTNPYVVQVYGNDKAAPITGTSGVVCKLTIEADASTAVGDYTITVRNIQLSALVGGTTTTITGADVDGGDFTVSVTENMIDLYDTDDVLPATASYEKVVLHRNFTANSWSTFVVPFDMDATQVENAFGSGVQIAKFSGQTIADTEIEIQFTSITEITANTPVIVKPAADLSAITVEGSISVAPEADPDDVSIVVGSGKKKSYMYGTYVPTTIKMSGDDYEFPLYIKGNKFYFAPAAGVTLKGYRGYFMMYETIEPYLTQYSVKMCIDEDPTAISSIDADYENGMTYTVDGKFVGKDVDLKRMQKGVYIVNGKKVINK